MQISLYRIRAKVGASLLDEFLKATLRLGVGLPTAQYVLEAMENQSKDLAALHKKLAEAGVVTSLRGDRKGQSYIRLSPHFYNTDAELRRVVELL